MKSFYKKKLNNQGFSLIEVLIAMAILAVLSLPILSNFSSAAKANMLARRTENASTIAQKVAENFKSSNLEEVLNNENGVDVGSYVVNPSIVGSATAKKIGIYNYDISMVPQFESDGVTPLNTGSYKYDSNLKKFTFDMTEYNGNTAKLDENGKPYMEGANGESFYVKAILNPADYSDNVGTNKDGLDNVSGNNVNSYKLPNFQDIDLDSNFVINDEITKYDNAALKVLKTYGATTKADIKKKVIIKARLDQVATGKFVQYLDMEITYTYVGDTSKKVTYTFEIQRSKAEREFYSSLENPQSIYVIYNVFGATNGSVADDEIEIHYSYPTDYWSNPAVTGKIDKALKVFLVEQSNSVSLTKANVKLYMNNSQVDFGRTYNDTINISSGPVSIYSNISDWNQNSFGGSDTSKNNITDVIENKYVQLGQKLYTMEIIVYLDNPDDPASEICRVTSTKEN